MIQSLLISNRGEITCEIIRTVAVYSDANANALHIRQASQGGRFGVIRL
jgi:acetyl/propionyl-CoA carboxylase alpha subunit